MAWGSSEAKAARSCFVGLRPPSGDGLRVLMKFSSITPSTLPSRQTVSNPGPPRSKHEEPMIFEHEHVQSEPGESAPFHFESCWRVNASAADVWSVLSAVDTWSQWWPGMPLAVPVDDTLEQGSRARIHVDSPLGVTMRFEIQLDEIRPPKFVSFSASGDLRGSGVWTIEQTGPVTTISSLWCVTSARTMIRMMRPVSSRMHAHVMRAGHRGLVQRLNRMVS